LTQLRFELATLGGVLGEADKKLSPAAFVAHPGCG